jgi:hypothetical protein
MARALIAFVEPQRMPERAALQAAIKQMRFALVVDEAWVPFETCDYLPCTLEGEDAGVYVRFEREAALPAAALAGSGGARSASVQLRWGGDQREQLAASIVAAALAEGFDALVLEAEGGTPHTADQLKARARKLHAELF